MAGGGGHHHVVKRTDAIWCKINSIFFPFTILFFMATVKCNFVIYCICIFSSISYFRNNGKRKKVKGTQCHKTPRFVPKRILRKPFWTQSGLFVTLFLKVIFMSKHSCHIEKEDLLLRTLSLSRDDNSLNDRIQRQDTTKQH